MIRNVTAKIGNMRKEKEFVVYAKDKKRPHIVTIQSDNRIARLNMENGKMLVSDGKGGNQGFLKLDPNNGAQVYEAPQHLLDQLQNLEEDHGEQTGPICVTNGSVMARL